MKRFLTTLVILTGLIGSGGAAWADDFDKGYAAYKAGDYAEAVKWFRKAAEQGFGYAQYNLAKLYWGGRGVLQDKIAILMWFNIAAANGHTGAVTNKDTVAKELSSADIVKAQKWAKRCMAWGYKGCDFMD